MRTRRSRIPGLCAGLGLLILAASCGGAATPSFPEEDQLLESLVEEYVLARFRFYPVESTLAGLPGNDGRLGSFTEADANRRVAALSDFHKKLLGLRPEALSRSGYLDALWLTSLVKMELSDLEERKVLERSAAFYAETIRTGLVSLLLAPDIATRTDSLASRLEAIPELLEQARENVEESSGLVATDGLDQLARCGQLLSDMPLLLEERVPSYRVAELAERSRVATRALQQLEARLLDGTPRARAAEIVPLGAFGLERFFLYREMVDWGAERLRDEAERAVAIATNRMTERALESFPDQTLTGLLSASVSTKSVEEDVIGHVQKVLAFLKASNEEDTPEAPIPVLVVPSYFLAPEKLRLWRPAALSPAKDAAILVSASAQTALSRELELHTLRELTGRYRLYVRQSESGSLLRRVYRARSASEAWASWFVERALEEGYAREDRELELHYLHQRVVEALRLSVSVRIHAFGLELGAAQREFRERGFLPPERARLEAEGAAIDPGAGSLALGRLLLEELAHDYEIAHPLASAREIEGLLLSESLVPLRLVRFKVLGLPSE
jgi:hypothetical protein